MVGRIAIDTWEQTVHSPEAMPVKYGRWVASRSAAAVVPAGGFVEPK